MPSLRQLLSTSIGLKITYFGFAAYAVHTLAKFYLPPPTSLSALKVVVIAFSILGPLGLIAALLSMIVTGVRGVRRTGVKSWWSAWAITGVAPFVVLAALILSFSAMVKDTQKTVLNNEVNLSHLQLLEKKLNEMKAKKRNPEMIFKVSRLYAKEAYIYKGEIVEYLDEAGNRAQYQPTDKDIEHSKMWKEMPQKIEEAQHGRSLEVAILFAIPLLTVIAAFLIPLRKKDLTLD